MGNLIKFQLSERQVFSLDLTGGWQSILYRLASLLALIMLAAVCLSLPFSSNGAGLTAERGMAYLLCVLVASLLSLSVLQMIIVGFRRLVDPPLFVAVLGFAFLCLTSFLFATADARNTFGPVGVKYVGGFIVMCFVVLYYTLALFINTQGRLWLLQLLLIITSTLLAMQDWSSVQAGGSMGFGLLLFWPLLLTVLYARSSVLKVIAGLGGLIALWAGLMDAQLNLAWILTCLIGIYALFNAARLPQTQLRGRALVEYWQKFRNGEVGLMDFLQATSAVSIGLFLIVLLLAGVAMAVQGNSVVASEAASAAERVRVVLSDLVSTGKLVAGKGALAAGTKDSLLVNVLNMQGLIGVLGYMILFWAVIWQVWDRVRTELKHSDQARIGFVWGVFLLNVIFSTLFLTPSFQLITLWWLSLCLLVCAELIRISSRPLLAATKRWQTNWLLVEHYLPALKFVLLLVLFIAFVYLLSALQTLVAQGLI